MRTPPLSADAATASNGKQVGGPLPQSSEVKPKMSNRSRAPADVSLGTGASIVRRLFWLPLWLFVGLAGAVLIGMLVVSSHSLQRLEPIEAHLRHIERIQVVERGMEQTLLNGLRGTPISPSTLHQLGGEVRQVAERKGALHPQTPARLNRIETQLGATQTRPADLLFDDADRDPPGARRRA